MQKVGVKQEQLDRVYKKLISPNTFYDLLNKGKIKADDDSIVVKYDVYLYKWNRKYPSDVKFPKDMLNDFKLEGSTDFEGNSHEKITEERYVRKK